MGFLWAAWAEPVGLEFWGSLDVTSWSCPRHPALCQGRLVKCWLRTWNQPALPLQLLGHVARLVSGGHAGAPGLSALPFSVCIFSRV